MQRVDISNPGERKKLIWAIGLGVVALLFLWWTFVGFGGGASTTRVAPGRTQNAPRPGGESAQVQTPGEIKTGVLNELTPIAKPQFLPAVAEAKRNIFAYYEPPRPPVAQASVPTPTPEPPPPVLLASISPSNVYAKTADFKIEITGDKLTPEVRVNVDGRELPTRYVGPQQVAATVSAAMIATPGTRQVMVRSADGKLYSNSLMLNVAAPPTPNYSYVGIIGHPRYLDTAILQDRGNREMLNVQRGDVLGGRFRVVSISEKELVLVDTTLKIRHALPFTTEGDKGFNPSARPTPRVQSDDDDP